MRKSDEGEQRGRTGRKSRGSRGRKSGGRVAEEPNLAKQERAAGESCEGGQ